ncbi:hypothetical protein EROM_030340 [Encephalitozoon romaleae SJ-2008]|uniref:DUF1764 domain-containing protein n=1 Tax=Encephalitozoon romaleae (strain SJ-2008) TaxID=1178016 RepID=I7ADL7_ENCRO|nr:hypothetical protein EROM_030340 [Encephalitozoon romaleae SJ-2008]AFN82655.1 hypothetical protein EROM_030340 [Encephalitozoon romaleae SJ-2008]
MRKTKKNNTRSKNSPRDGLEGGKGHKTENDIEAIFSKVDSPKICKVKEGKEDEESDKGRYFSVGEGGRRYHEGLPVYTLEELQLGDGGGDTEDCPIYCDCCT